MAAKTSTEEGTAPAKPGEPKTLKAWNKLIAAAEPPIAGSRRAVLGEGPIGAKIAFVGEQPGDQEDLAGHPFVGPAGQLLDKAMTEVGIDRSKVMSPTPSSISNSSNAARSGSTRSRPRAR